MPFGPSDSIKKALDELLAATPAGQEGGHVIFTDEKENWVQFALDPNGLYLYWPDVARTKPDRAIPVLLDSGFVEDHNGDIPRMRNNTYVQADDGLYAQFGRNADSVERFTLRAFREIFGIEPETLDIELEVEP